MSSHPLDLLEHVLPPGISGNHAILERPGCRIHYWLCGPADGPPVVLTHANLTDHRQFNLQLTHLVHDYRVLLWDVRGHGASRPTAQPFAAATALADLGALLDTLGWNTATFVGHSMGGNLAQAIAQRQPERVHALYALGCACNTLELSDFERLAIRLTPTLLRLYPFAMLKRQSANASSTVPEVRTYLQDIFDRLERGEFIQLSEAMTSFLQPEADYRIDQPLTIVVGEHDATGNIRKAARVWAERDEAPLEWVPDAGHCAQLDNPAWVTASLLSFLKKHAHR